MCFVCPQCTISPELCCPGVGTDHTPCVPYPQHYAGLVLHVSPLGHPMTSTMLAWGWWQSHPLCTLSPALCWFGVSTDLTLVYTISSTMLAWCWYRSHPLCTISPALCWPGVGTSLTPCVPYLQHYAGLVLVPVSPLVYHISSTMLAWCWYRSHPLWLTLCY